MSEKDDSTITESTDVDTDRADDTQDSTDSGDTETPLGPKGEKALAAEKDKRKAAQAETRELKRRIAELEKSGKGEDKSDDNDPSKIREQARAEARAEVLKDRALDKIEAKAAKLFADPEDARALLASSVDDFIDGGKVDTDAINEALSDLLERKPHLAAQGGKRFKGTADGGANRGASRPSQLTTDDLNRMSPDQIMKAKNEGRLNDVLGRK